MDDQTKKQLLEFPHLISPAALALADAGLYSPKHWLLMNAKLMEFIATDAARLMINIPWQHGKTTLCTIYFIAWTLLLFPKTRIILVCYNEEYAMLQGSRVKDVIERWGRDLDVLLKEDQKKKGEWVIAKHGGGMVCKGLGGGTQGRPADIFVIDDPIQDAEEALSPTILQKQWEWYQTVVIGRTRKVTKIMIVTTRWCRNDLCGRVLERSRKTGHEKWDVVKLRALATENDPLGRKPGEPLWPEQVTLEMLEDIKKSDQGKWWNAAYQQEPVDEEGADFKPYTWPKYVDMGDAYVLLTGNNRQHIYREDLLIFVTTDWAMSERKGSDYTAICIFGLTQDGRLLVLDILNKRIPLERIIKDGLAPMCRKWKPVGGTVEIHGFQASLANECRAYREIPELRRLKRENKPNAKLYRSLPAKLWGDNGRIYLPEKHHDWMDDALPQLASFTGIDDDHDDIVDCFSDAGTFANQTRGYVGIGRSSMPQLLIAGPERLSM